MKKLSSVLWGLVFITLGVILGGKALGIFNIDIFFDGWWSLFIIVPCTIGFITGDNRLASFIFLLLGVYLLLACQNVIGFDVLWKLILPVLAILLGLIIIFKAFSNNKFNEDIAKLSKKIDSDDESSVAFGGTNINLDGKEFKGKNVSAAFGSLKLDLRKAKIKEDAIINATAVFGEVEILVPEDVAIETKSSSVFGGVSNKKTSPAKDGAPTLYISGTAVFGAVEIKS